jgi:hypothetical protein
MSASRHLKAARVLVFSGALLGAACSGPPGDQTFVPIVPTMEGFPAVSEALEWHCGTLDCHGNSARNMRVYGNNGIRFGKGLAPGSDSTTDAERLLTYEAVIAIQPEVLGQIVSQHGAKPERWIVITKGRGTEHHKGGSRMRLHDATDTCITSWLTGVVNTDACEQAASVAPPEIPGF